VKPRYEALDGLRGIAALAVLIFHVSGPFGGVLAPRGYLAVDFFFVLSGFVIAEAYEDRLAAGGWFWPFMRKRLVRLWPLMALGILLGLGAFLWKWRLGGGPQPAALALMLVSALLIIPTAIFNNTFPYNSGEWTLFYELLVNATYGRVVRYVTTSRLLAFVAVAAAALAFVMIRYHSPFGGGLVLSEWPEGLARAVFSFSAGLLIHRLQPRIRIPALAAAAGMVAIFSIPALPIPTWAVDLPAILLVFPLIVAGAANASGGRASRLSGRLSYPLYAIHIPIVSTFSLFLQSHHVSGVRFPLWIGAELAVTLALAFAAMVADERLRWRLAVSTPVFPRSPSPLAGPSIQTRLADAQMRPSGFDYMRFALALSVIFFHGTEFSGRTPALPFLHHWPFNAWDLSVVPMFFALSGFLVAGSLDRARSLLDFIGFRVLRIFPALAVDTLFSATVLGLLLTTLPPEVYVSSPGFRAYFLNMFGDIHYFLPGVFAFNPYPLVNVQLWTIPYELGCYLALVGLALAGVYRRRALFLAITLVAILLLQTWIPATDYRHGLAVPSFLAGVAMHLYRDRVPWSPWLFLTALLAMAATAVIPHMARCLPIPLAYVTVFLGTLNPKKVWPIKAGDYSYGMYLYGFPMAQALIATVPAARVWYGNFVLTTLAAGGLAFLSWHVVEKSFLALKPRLFALNAHLLGLWPRGLAGVRGLRRSA
jgi:peptidoglycan/LPS O-acetylase OafA/YrhL